MADDQAAGYAFDLRVCGEGRGIDEEQTVFRRGGLGRAETETETGTGEHTVAQGNDDGERQTLSLYVEFTHQSKITLQSQWQLLDDWCKHQPSRRRRRRPRPYLRTVPL